MGHFAGVFHPKTFIFSVPVSLSTQDYKWHKLSVWEPMKPVIDWVTL